MLTELLDHRPAGRHWCRTVSLTRWPVHHRWRSPPVLHQESLGLQCSTLEGSGPCRNSTRGRRIHDRNTSFQDRVTPQPYADHLWAPCTQESQRGASWQDACHGPSMCWQTTKYCINSRVSGQDCEVAGKTSAVGSVRASQRCRWSRWCCKIAWC